MRNYSNQLDLKNFIHMLDDTTECYKFYWFDAILSIMSEGKFEIEFDRIIDQMIADAWYSVSEYHLHLGLKDGTGKIMNSLERAVNKLIARSELEHEASPDKIMTEIKRQNQLIRDEKYQISKMVPYRLLSPFLVEVRGNDKIWDQKKRLIAYIKEMNEKNRFPYIIEDAIALKKRVVISEAWRQMLLDYMVPIRSWIKLKKIRYLQDRNPGVPGIIYKLEPENERTRKLAHVRKLWSSIMELSPVRDIYSDRMISPKEYEVDHFIPWSYIANDEIWNLVPMESSLNSSKGNRLPRWETYFRKFAGIQYGMYCQVQELDVLFGLFQECHRDNLASIWASEELYQPGISEEKFMSILDNNMRPIYDSAQVQGYAVWNFLTCVKPLQNIIAIPTKADSLCH